MSQPATVPQIATAPVGGQLAPPPRIVDSDSALLMHLASAMVTQRDLDRRRLLERRDVLVQHFHDALEDADHELDACELEDAMVKAASWQAHVLARLGDELHELHDVIEALDRFDRRCGTPLDGSPSCDECAITEVVRSPALASRALRSAAL